MSEDNQENGAANGDVPEIELIIKDETNIIKVSESEDDPMSPKQLDETCPPVMKVCSGNDEYIIYELKSDTQPMYSYVITNPKEPPPDCVNSKEDTTTDRIVSSVTEVLANPGPYTISVEIPVENYQTENSKENSPKTKRALARKRLAEAVIAVVNKEFTIGKAAKAFEVTKSTLWKEVNKHTNHRKKKVDEDLNKKIADRICAGESLSEISRSLNVAKSTIHLHKVRLAQARQLPRSVTLKPPVDKMEQIAIKNRIIRAFRAIRVNGMSLRLASTYFSVPRSTLWKHIRRFKASQKEQTKDAQHAHESENALKDGVNENSSEEISSEEEDSAEDEDNNLHESENENVPQVDENTSDVQSTTTEGDNQDDFNLLNAYCAQHINDPSEEGDFFISFDFETFEEYVKTELEN